MTFNSYWTIIDELILRNVKKLKEKQTPKKQQGNLTDDKSPSSAQEELMNMAKKTSKN